MKDFLGRLGALLLFSLLLVKISAFHIYEHHDTLDGNAKHCEICLLTLEGQQLEGTIPAAITFDGTRLLVSYEPQTVYYSRHDTDALRKGELFSRPPPQLMP